MEFKIVKRGLGKNRKYYFKGSDGKTYGEGYDEAYNFINGFARIKKGDKYYFIDKNFKTHGEGYSHVFDFDKNGFARVIKDGLYYYIDTKFNCYGEGYEMASGFDKNGFAKIEIDYGTKFFVSEEEFRKTGKSNLYREPNDWKEGYRQAYVYEYQNCKYYFIDNKEFKLHGEGYDYIWPFNKGFAKVKKDDKYYFIDKDFKCYSEGVDEIGDFDENGIAIVVKDDKYYYLDNKEFTLHGEGYDNTPPYSFKNGFIRIAIGGKWFYMDNKKFQLHGEGYAAAEDFACNGIATVYKNGERYKINKKFEIVDKDESVDEDIIDSQKQ